MSVRFIIGRAGTGKSKHCFDSIVAAMRADPLGPAIYWLLPKQATFSAERELTTLSGLGGFCRARVLSFEMLGDEVLQACGGAAVPEVSALGRQMLLGFLLRRHQDELKFFRSVARQPGLAARLDATFAEFERCGKDADALAALLQSLDGDEAGIEHGLLRDKVTDFHLLYRAYRDALGQERVDPHRRLEQVLSCITDHKPLRGASVFIDDFREFTDRQRRMIAALGRVCAGVDITLLIDPASATLRDPHHLPDEMSLFHRTETTYRQLVLTLTEAGVVIDRPLVLKSPKRFESKSLAAIERTLFEPTIKFENAADGVELIEAADRRTEVDAAARRIRELLRDGLRLRDIAVLMRDVDDYERLISASFREHDIRYFVDRRKAASHHPLLQFVRSLLVIARQNWPHDALMGLMKTGMAGLTLDEVEELENYVLLHRIKGSAWAAREPWNYCRTLTRSALAGDDADPAVLAGPSRTPGPTAPYKNGGCHHFSAARMDGLRRGVVDRLFTFITASGRERTVREIVVALFNTFKDFGVRETLGEWIERAVDANDIEQSGEHEQVWAELIKLFDQMVDLLGEQTVSLADFAEILEAGLEQFDLALTPPRIDQVLVGQINRTRTPRIDTTIVLGLSEGQFPRIGREDSVLSDAERRNLQRHHLEIDPDSERRLLDENLLGYIAFTRASRRLIVTRAAAQEKKPVGPSAFWTRLTRLFPKLQITQEKRESESPAGAIGTPRQLVTALMRWARSNDAGADQQQPWNALYHWLRDHPFTSDAIDVMRFKAWRALAYENLASLSADIAKQLTGDKLNASVTRIETFATCPFKHFARYHLGLSQREEDDVTPMDLGQVYHRILEGVVVDALKSRKDWCAIERKVTAKMINQLAELAGRELRGELMLSTARNKYLLSRIEKNLAQVCATQQRVLSRGAFRPAYAELEFGFEGGKLPPLDLRSPKGRQVLLRGKIDRVDLAQDGSAATVMDYKMRDHRLALYEVYHGLSLQLLTYLLVLQASGHELAGKKLTPAAAFYSTLLRTLEAVDHPDEAPDETDPAFDLRIKPRGIFDAHYLKALDTDLATGASEVVAAYINKDGNFGRVDSSDVAESGEFAALLKYVQKRIVELADQMMDGLIEARPYRIGRDTPCAHCDYRSLCRFDPAINVYLTLPMMKRSQVLEIVRQEGG